MPELEKIPIPQQVKDKMQNLGIAEEEIDQQAVVLYSLFNQAVKGNVSAITQIQKMFNDKEEKKETAKDITKDVEKEEKRIKANLTSLTEEQLEANKDFIHQIAFQSVQLKYLADDIAKHGVKEKYKNGANQWRIQRQNRSQNLQQHVQKLPISHETTKRDYTSEPTERRRRRRWLRLIRRRRRMSYIEEYYQWLLDNPDRANHKVLVVYKKLVEDIKKPKKVTYFNQVTEENETHTFVLDEGRGRKPIKFIETYCKHSKGKWAGQPVILELWQKALIEAAFGFVDQETRLRKYRKVLFFVARKNGKSTLDSGLSLYMLTKDGEGGAEVYSVATKRDQAKIVWEEAKRMIKKSPALDKRTRCLVGGIYYDKTESYMKALASDSNSLDGLNTHFGVRR